MIGTAIRANGVSLIPKFGFGAVESVTLATGVAAVTKSYVILVSESGATDDCTSITGLDVGDIIVVTAEAGDTITLKDSASLIIGGDKALTGDNGDTIMLICSASGVCTAMAGWADN